MRINSRLNCNSECWSDLAKSRCNPHCGLLLERYLLINQQRLSLPRLKPKGSAITLWIKSGLPSGRAKGLQAARGLRMGSGF